MTTQLAKWGNSLAVRLPKTALQAARLQEGDKIEVQVDESGTIVLVPSRRWTRLERLVSQIRPENRHQESEWGGRPGGEAW